MQSNSCFPKDRISLAILGLLISSSVIALLIAFAYSYKRNVWSIEDKADWTTQCTQSLSYLPPPMIDIYCECAQKALDGWRSYAWFDDDSPPTEAERDYMRNVHMTCAQKAIQAFGVLTPTL